MKRAKVGLEIGIYAVVGLALATISFRQVVLSRFDLLLGDVGDARLIGVILEHWWQVFRGAAPWLSPSFFFPVQGVLGYSEAGFLFALPYAGLRLAGLGTLVSYQIVLYAVIAAGWIGTILFLRRCLGLGVFATTLGAALFVFPNSIGMSVESHVQLLANCAVPYLAIGIYVFVRDLSNGKSVDKISVGVTANAEITMAMEIAAPARPGKYWLEIEAVQELVAWFKDKGSPGIRIGVDVR